MELLRPHAAILKSSAAFNAFEAFQQSKFETMKHDEQLHDIQDMLDRLDRAAVGGDAKSVQTAMDALRSIDMQAATALYNEIEPVLDELFHELGYPETKTFRGRLTEACTVILETPVMKGEGGLVHVAANLYKYSNPQLESLLPVQKLLMRLGETNREELRRCVLEFSAQLKLYAE